MNKTITEGKWKSLKGKVRQQWGDLTSDEVEKSRGNVDELIGKIQEKYGYEKERAAKEFNQFLDKFNK